MRQEQQKNARRKFEFVLQMVKKKLLSHNRRVETLLFSSIKPMELASLDVSSEDTAFISLFDEMAKTGSSGGSYCCSKCRTTSTSSTLLKCASCNDFICMGSQCRKTCYKCIHVPRVFCTKCISFCRTCWFWYCKPCDCLCNIANTESVFFPVPVT